MLLFFYKIKTLREREWRKRVWEMWKLHMRDVISVIQLVRNHIIVIAAALVVMIAVMIFARKFKKPAKGFIRWQSLIAFVVVTALTVNNMLSGALYNTINVVLADKRGTVTGECRQFQADYRGNHQ